MAERKLPVLVFFFDQKINLKRPIVYHTPFEILLLNDTDMMTQRNKNENAKNFHAGDQKCQIGIGNDVKGISGLFVKVSSPQKSKLDRTGKTHQLNLLKKRGKTSLDKNTLSGQQNNKNKLANLGTNHQNKVPERKYHTT